MTRQSTQDRTARSGTAARKGRNFAAAFLIVDDRGTIVRVSGWEKIFAVTAPDRISTDENARDPLLAAVAGAIGEAGETGGLAHRVVTLDLEPPRTINITAASLALGGGGSNTAVVIQTFPDAAATGPEGKAIRKLDHDLRSPLTSIGGAAELLESGRLGPMTAEQIRCLGVIQKGMESLLGHLEAAAVPFRTAALPDDLATAIDRGAKTP